MTLADFESFGALSVTETIDPGRAKVVDFWAPGKTTKSARTLGNPNEYAGIGKKNPTGDPVGFYVWWSWGELNPRPRDIFVWFYVRSRLIWISLLRSRSNTLPKTPVTLNLTRN